MIIPFISSKPSITVSTGGGLEILTPQFEYLPVNQSHDFYWHLFNETTMLTNTTANCSFHLYDKQDEGQHINQVNNVKSFTNGRDFEVDVPVSNFTKIGAYCVLIECNTISQTGGIEKCFEVTYNGKELQPAQAILYGSLILLLVLFVISLLIVHSSLPDGNSHSDDGRILSISKLKYIRPAILVLSYFMVAFICYIASNLSFAYLSETLVANVFFFLFRIMMVASPVIVIVWFITIFFSVFEDKEMKKIMLMQGMNVENNRSWGR
jgi:hypothetical protein